MNAGSDHQAHSEKEASDWFARLNARKISTDDLMAFRAWKRAPENQRAYDAIEAVWRESGRLKFDLDIKADMAEMQAKRERRRRWNVACLGGGLAFAVLCVGVTLVSWPLLQGQVLSTKVGENRVVALEDGSRVRLDTNTRLFVHFTKTLRSVVIERGQAFFDVVHRSDRPFIVTAGATRIEDLGTAFDVRRDEAQVRITLVSGAVNVWTGGSGKRDWSLEPGQQLVAGPQGVTSSKIDAVKATSWTAGRLIFDDVSLASATAEVNRYGSHKIILEDSIGPALRVSGSFKTADTDAFVVAVSALYDLKVSHEADGSILIGPVPEKPSV